MDTYEKKYKESMAKMSAFLAKHDNFTISKDGEMYKELSEIFDELKESEDEQHRKWILEYLYDGLRKSDEQFKDHFKCAISWFEKQGEHANFINKIQIGDKVTRNEDGVLVNLSQLNRVAKKYEKQCEQKPADETKFKVGDWVVYCNDDVDLITGIEENGYCINNGGYIPFVCESDIRLWTIEDAKDGDVLVASDGSIFIFKGAIDCACKHYVALTTDDVVKFNEGLEHYWETSTAVHPATKKQRDLLFQKLKESGYEWDAEHKQLNKIEKKYATMSLDEAIEHCKEKSCGNNACALEHKQLEKWLTELKELKEQKPTWSEEDEEIYRKCICAMRASACGFPEEEKFVEQVDNWFKSLKDRVACEVNCTTTKEWSAGDKVMLGEIIDFFENGTVKLQHDLSLYASWLKSLRPQSTWKPSDEQIEALRRMKAAIAGEGEIYKPLNLLYEDLLKLRDE